MSGLRFTFECGCRATYWPQGDKIKGGLSCCKLHEGSGQSIANIIKSCPLVLTGIGARVSKAKTDLSKVPTNALWKELERRESEEYLRRVNQELRMRAADSEKSGGRE